MLMDCTQFNVQNILLKEHTKTYITVTKNFRLLHYNTIPIYCDHKTRPTIDVCVLHSISLAALTAQHKTTFPRPLA